MYTVHRKTTKTFMSEQRFIRSIANIAVLRLYTDKVHQSIVSRGKSKTQNTQNPVQGLI